MVMLAADPSVTTIEQLLAIPEDGLRHELLRGEHVVTPSPRVVHQAVQWDLMHLIAGFIADRGDLRGVTAPCDVRLGPDTLVQPDICVFRVGQAEMPSDWTEFGVPELVVEIISPGTAKRDRADKREIYQGAGVNEYWIVDIDSQMVERWLPPDDRPELLRDRIDWKPDEDRGRLEIDLRDVFRRAR